VFRAAALALALAPPAEAQSPTWVSGRGADEPGCGTVAAPCRSLQYAADTSQSAEIRVRDPGEFGRVETARSLSIINDGAGTAELSRAGAISIHGDGVVVYLRGLLINGDGEYGIDVKGEVTLTIDTCQISHFRFGILRLDDNAPLRLTLTRTVLDHNGHGILVELGRSSVIDIGDSTISNSSVYGAWFATKGDAASKHKINIYGSTIEYNDTGVGAYVSSSSLIDMTVTNSSILDSRRSGFGFISHVSGGVSLAMTRSILNGNTVGIQINDAKSVTLKSAGDNYLVNNGQDIVGGSFTKVLLQ
jgi:hypothetical protein